MTAERESDSRISKSMVLSAQCFPGSNPRDSSLHGRIWASVLLLSPPPRWSRCALRSMTSHDSLFYFAKLNPGTLHVTGERDMHKQWYLQMACSLHEIRVEAQELPILLQSRRIRPRFLVCRSSRTTAHHWRVTRTAGSNPALGHMAAQQPGSQLAILQDCEMRSVCTQIQGRKSTGPRAHCRQMETVSKNT